MAPVKIPDRLIDLSAFIDVSQYTMYAGFYDGAHVRMSSYYRVNSDTDVSTVGNPGKCTADHCWVKRVRLGWWVELVRLVCAVCSMSRDAQSGPGKQ